MDYLIRLTIDDKKVIKSTSCSDVQSAENDVFFKAIKCLEDNVEQMADESMSESLVEASTDSSSVLKEEIKQVKVFQKN